jgi:glycosyltransferase involved in cell wall biosynthesis
MDGASDMTRVNSSVRNPVSLGAKARNRAERDREPVRARNFEPGAVRIMLEATIASETAANRATALRNASTTAETAPQFGSADRRMRWCFYSPGWRSLRVLAGDTSMSGGAEAQVAHLAAAMAQRGHEVSLIYGDGEGCAPPTTIAGVLCLDAAPSWRRPSSAARLWRALKDVSPTILYARLPDDFLWLVGLIGRLRSRTRFIYAVAHDDHCKPWSTYRHRPWFHNPLYALGLHSADTIAIQHEGQRTRLPHRLRGRTVAVPNLLRSFASRPRPLEGAQIDALWVAQIRPEKRLERFLDLAGSCPGLRFSVAGGFDPTLPHATRCDLERKMRSLSNVTFLGPTQAAEIMALLEDSKVLVNTSEAEGFPNTMLEAWSAGVPVLSLAIDPGHVIETQALGRVSRTTAGLRSDLHLLTKNGILNQEMGKRALDYVRRRHNTTTACDLLETAALGRQVSVPVDGTAQLQDAMP